MTALKRSGRSPHKKLSHPRISRDLGPLPARAVLSEANHTTIGLLQILRSLAIKNQREHSRIFYSLREVAGKFRFPVSTVSDTYQVLEEEGLLSRVRGSKTILNGLRYRRRRSRAFIGLPAVLSNFITIQDYRRFFVCLRHELWTRGFATTMLFFRPEDAFSGALADQLKTYEIDTVVWLHPGRSAKESFLRFSDMGIRIVSISQIGTPILPSRYYTWRETAVDTLLRNWKMESSVRKVTVVLCNDYRSAVTEEILRLVLANLEIEAVTSIYSGEGSSAFLRNLCHAKTGGIIFPSAGLASLFAFQCPGEVTDLIRAQRVAFLDGPIDMPFAQAPDAPVDLITHDWPGIAESIVNDLVTLKAFDRNLHTTFEAQAQLRVPFSNFAEPILPTRGIGTV